ncbi:MAG: exosortase/archaeosortase family protein [Candidatus Nanoarchaeia archaeon]|nr:exosortase/archaeosortase family protein [Candidatus Nanoarchaeia archaeon]
MQINNRKLLDIFQFLLVFTLLGIPLYWFIASDIDLYAVELVQAGIVAKMISLSGYSVSITDTISLESLTKVPIVLVEGFETGIGIDRACTGYRSLYAFFALVVASPRTKWKRKLRGLFSGVLVISFFNIIRLYSTSMTGVLFGFDALEIMHTVLWRYGMLALVLVLWYLWLKKSAVSHHLV